MKGWTVVNQFNSGFAKARVKTWLLLIAAGVGSLSFGLSPADAQIFVGSNLNTIAEYNLNGTLIDPNFVTGLSNPQDILVSGNDLFVANSDSGTVGEYTTSGAVVNKSLITGLSGPHSLAISGNSLFIVYDWGLTKLAKYDLTTGTLNPTFVTSLPDHGAVGISDDGQTLFASTSGTSGISEYNAATGASINPSFAKLNGVASKIIVDGSNLFVQNDRAISEYTTSGSLVKDPLVSLRSVAYPLAEFGSDLYTSVSNSQVSEYTTSGATVATDLLDIGRNNFIYSIAVVPEPASITVMGLTVFALRRRHHHPNTSSNR